MTSASYSGPRVLVIGLDGATSRLLDPWFEQGALPNLNRLRQQGAYGPLRSTIRPESSVAWSSFATGLNPGRHGIFGFAGHIPGSYRTQLMTGANLGAEPFWRHLADSGTRVGIFNVPVVAYPPKPLPEGSFSVGGLMTPQLDSDFTWPIELRDELLAQVPGYRLDVDHTGLSDAALIEEIAHLTRTHLAAVEYLIESRRPELMIAVFMATDRIQHYLWQHLDSSHPHYDPVRSPGIAPAILALYRQLDEAVGRLMDLTAPGALTLVLSDHGFNGCHRSFSVNAWLASNCSTVIQRQWLTSRTGAGARGLGARFLQRMRAIPGLRQLKAMTPGLRNRSLVRTWQPDPTAWIVWPETLAYFSEVGGIRINLRGREPEGVVPEEQYNALRDELIDMLRKVHDPLTGHAPVSAVYRREELYSGPLIDGAPDLIVEPRRDAANPRENYLLAHGRITTGAVFGEMPGLSGNHDLDGILIAAGGQVQSGPLLGARLWDLAPTICQALNAPIPNNLDGALLAQIVLPTEARYEDSGEDPGRVPDGSLTDDEEADVADRLRGLGYLS